MKLKKAVGFVAEIGRRIDLWPQAARACEVANIVAELRLKRTPGHERPVDAILALICISLLIRLPRRSVEYSCRAPKMG